MLKSILIWAGGSLLFGLLTGCSDVGTIFLSSEGKINAAFPISEAVRNGKIAALETASNVQKKEINSQFDTRLKLRALSCAKGYSPSWHSTSEEIRKKLNGQLCFAAQDSEIAKWFGLRRVGFILAKPVLQSIPKKAPPFLSADEFIAGARFAASAGVALIATQQSIELIDVHSTKQMLREAKGVNQIGYVSDNGLLFTTGDMSTLKIRSTESGAIIAEIPSVRAHDFFWIDDRTGLYNNNESGKSFLVDFSSGSEVPIKEIAGSIFKVVPAPNSENQYVIFSGKGITKVELVREKTELELKLLAEKTISGIAWASNTSGLTADGSHYFDASRNLTLVSLDSLDVKSETLEPFYLQTGTATPDPDKIIVTGFMQPSQGEAPRNYLYSINGRTLTPIDQSKIPSTRYIYISSLQKQAVIADKKITVLEDLPLLDPIPLEKFISDNLEISNQRKLDASIKLQAQEAAMNGTYMPTIGRANGLISNLVNDAIVEGVGVYQGSPGGPKTPDGRKMGLVEVRIKPSTKPIVLILSSYEPVKWILIPESGVKIAAVLVSGYYPSQVVGAGTARIINTGSTFAYKLGTPEYLQLNQEAIKWTGKTIGVFQGRYEGSSFNVN